MMPLNTQTVKPLFILLVALGTFVFSDPALAGNLGFRGFIFDSDGVTPLPGTGLTNLATADPALPYGYVQAVYAGLNGVIDPPNPDGSTSGDDSLLIRTEVGGQFFTAIGEGFPFGPQGNFFEDFNHSLTVGSNFYVRVWNKTAPLTSDFYGDSSLYTLVSEFFDSNDFGVWSTNIPISSGPSADFDNDGDVDSADLVVWESSFGIGAGADADSDGDSDGNDFLVWQQQFTGPAIAVAAVVPEPATVALVLSLVAFGLFRTRYTVLLSR